MNCKYCNKRLRKGSKFCTECGHSVNEVETPIVEETPSKGLAIASIVIGSVSMLLGLFMFIIVPGIGLTLGLVQKGKSTEKTVGVVLNSVAIGLGVFAWIIFGAFFITLFGGIFGEDGFFDRIDRIEERFDGTEPYGKVYSENWNKYKYKIGETKVFGDSVIGEWVLLGEEDEVCTFDKEEFRCYTEGDQENNYVYGSYKETSLYNDSVSRGRIRATYDNLDVSSMQFLVLKPIREVINGEEQEQDDEEYGILWIVVNHDEGQEAQTLLFEYDEDDEKLSEYGRYEYFGRIK